MTTDQATHILTIGFGRATTALSVAPAAGGMVSSVWLVTFDRAPGRAVLKVSDKEDEVFAREHSAIDTVRRQTRFPVPEAYFHLDRAAGAGLGALALEWIDGVNLGAVSLSPAGRRRLDEEIAAAVIDLHRHTRPEFGDLAGARTTPRWLDVFAPMLSENVEDCDGRTDPATVAVGRRVVARLPEILAGRTGPARLVHGDIWANNILVRPDGHGGAALSAFIDLPAVQYADPEYELAYLDVFSTVGPRFFELYREAFPEDPGYPLRRTIYHLNTLLLHVWLFGNAHYHRRAAAIAATISAAV